LQYIGLVEISTGTILQTCQELASFQLVELHLIPTSQGGMVARGGSTPPSTISAVPQ
jgi:hypothetical protein